MWSPVQHMASSEGSPNLTISDVIYTKFLLDTSSSQYTVMYFVRGTGHVCLKVLKQYFCDKIAYFVSFSDNGEVHKQVTWVEDSQTRHNHIATWQPFGSDVTTIWQIELVQSESGVSVVTVTKIRVLLYDLCRS